MKAITLWQPWASLLAEGVKWIETRPRPHPWRSAVGETIAIHAAVRTPETAGTFGEWNCTQFGDADQWHLWTWDRFTSEKHDLWVPLGHVLATARLTAVVPMAERITPRTFFAWESHHLIVNEPPDGHLAVWDENEARDVEDQRPYGNFAVGRWALLFDKIERLPDPILARGHQGFWTWNEADYAPLPSREGSR